MGIHATSFCTAFRFLASTFIDYSACLNGPLNTEKMWFSLYCSIPDVLRLLLFYITFRLIRRATLKFGCFYNRA